MARKRTSIKLDALEQESSIELEAMMAELTGETAAGASGAKDAHWSKRFAASGKDSCGTAPRIRER